MRTSALAASLVAAALVAPATAFAPAAATSHLTTTAAPCRRPAAALASKGFGKKPEKAAPKPKTAGQIEREKAAAAYDDLAASGVPEHNIFVRVKGTGEQDWVPAGTMAVPRTEKVANAVFEQQEALLKGVYRFFPKLEGLDLEYGSNLKMYPDEPVKVLEPKARSDDAIKNWFESLLSPLNSDK